MPCRPESDPQELIGQVGRLLAAVPGLERLANAPLEPLGGGRANHAWRVEAAGGPLYVRLNSDDGERLGVDRRSECALLATASEAGLAPELCHCDPERGLLVTRYIQGRPWTRQAATEKRNLRRFARMLQHLHSLPPTPAVARVDFRCQAARLAATIPRGRIDDSLRLCAEAAFARLARRNESCLCHNDAHHLNIVDDGERLWLVDWEYGGRGDGLYDLASFLCEQEADRATRGELLACYGLAAASAMADLDDACWAFDYVRWLWYLARGRPPGGPEADEFDAMLEKLEARLAAGENAR